LPVLPLLRTRQFDRVTRAAAGIQHLNPAVIRFKKQFSDAETNAYSLSLVLTTGAIVNDKIVLS
jgi:hypothetical protein